MQPIYLSPTENKTGHCLLDICQENALLPLCQKIKKDPDLIYFTFIFIFSFCCVASKRWGSTTSRLEPLPGSSLRFNNTKFSFLFFFQNSERGKVFVASNIYTMLAPPVFNFKILVKYFFSTYNHLLNTTCKHFK